MSDILKKILSVKHEEIIDRKRRLPIEQLISAIEGMPKSLNFHLALKKKNDASLPGVIAEIKKASPSKGIIREHFDPGQIAREYEAAGASCISVLTDKTFFQGDETDLKLVKSASSLPVIRKDFIIDEYQVFETKGIGADCLLLICSALELSHLAELKDLAEEQGLDVLIEVHNETEMEQALTLKPNLIGINNRDLSNFTTSLDTTIHLKDLVPEETVLITESGIHSRADVERMIANKVYCFLIGEAFMKEASPGSALVNLFPPSAN